MTIYQLTVHGIGYKFDYTVTSDVKFDDMEKLTELIFAHMIRENPEVIATFKQFGPPIGQVVTILKSLPKRVDCQICGTPIEPPANYGMCLDCHDTQRRSV